MLPLADALARISAKTPIGSALRSAEWAEVPLALRERAQFSAGVASMKVLGAIQERLAGQISQQREQLANGKQATFDRSSFINAIRDIARSEGLTPADPAERDTIRDITSIPRLGLIFDMQNAQASGYAAHKLDMNEGALALWPAYRFGPSTARVPRADWERRWAAAGAQVGWEGASRTEMVALKTSPIWAALSIFGTPWAPFDWGSTRELEDVDREEAVALGLLGENDLPPAGGGDQGFNDKLEASVKDLPPEMRSVLKEHFGPQIEVDGGTARWQKDRGTEYETQRKQQSTIAREVASSLVSHPLRPGDRTPDMAGGMAETNLGAHEEEIGAHVSAVASGRKPLYHDAWGDLAPALEAQLRRALPANVEVRAEGGQVYAWRPDVLRLPFKEIQHKANDGTTLGYGVNRPSMDTERAHVKIIGPSGQVISAFYAPPGSARLWARLRTQDFTDAYGHGYRYTITRLAPGEPPH